MYTEIALRIADKELQGRAHIMEMMSATEEGIIQLEGNQFAVSILFEAKTEDTDFEVGATAGNSAIAYNSENCLFEGHTSAGLDVYRSHHVELYSGSISIAATGTPKPYFCFTYLLFTIE